MGLTLDVCVCVCMSVFLGIWQRREFLVSPWRDDPSHFSGNKTHTHTHTHTQCIGTNACLKLDKASLISLIYVVMSVARCSIMMRL